MPTNSISELRAKAAHVRELAVRLDDPQARANLKSYADDLEDEASKLEAQFRTSISEEDK